MAKEMTATDFEARGKAICQALGLPATAIDWAALWSKIAPEVGNLLLLLLAGLLGTPGAMAAGAKTKCCPEHLELMDLAVEAACASLTAAVKARECCCCE